MAVMQLNGGVLATGLTNTGSGGGVIKKITGSSVVVQPSGEHNAFALIKRKGLRYEDVTRCHHQSLDLLRPFSPLVTCRRKHVFPVFNNHLGSDCGVDSSEVEENIVVEKGNDIGNSSGVCELKGITATLSRSLGVKRELIMLSLPAMAGQALDPLAQLMETAYIGRLGPVELASAGVSISIFNIISKLFNIPLLSISTSFVAEDISKNAINNSASEEFYQEESTNGTPFVGVTERMQLSSVSTALLLAVGIGIFEAFALYFGSGWFLNLMGIPSASSMHAPARRFLSLRALGAPAVVVSLALQGILRGFKDTKTPVLCLGVGNFAAVFLFPILMYYFQLGVTGAAISTVVSQYIVTFLMIWHLNKRAVLLPPKMGTLQFGDYIKSGGFLLGRTLAVLATMTLATSVAARQGPIAMAGHQICLQVWLAVSLLTDALAASAQAMIASSLSKGDYKAVKEITYFVLKTGLFTGIFLAVALSAFYGSLATIFTKDIEVLGIVRTGVLFVCASQPINSLAFIFDGLHFGASDFPYAARSMMVIGAICSAFLLYVPSLLGLQGVWLGLTLFMGLRMVAGVIRLASKTGPWWFLHEDFQTAEVMNFGSKTA
ncbi:protein DETOXIFICATION 45, chloroplastic [Vitis riparia]|uniref:protein DETOXIFICATION 45, chloroplastic n=1 Tax=Vitis riparia TaxID=96939 RepID=UPI00155A2885|nr:protein DETOXIFICATION 45, chloroplastic [Vitis riparia]XP_034681492.1 protein DETOXIFICATION 45, chloroplastic [Vitis riparia]XP_034681493.1 protein DETOXIFICATION 45, chloroplastic [Vitis riparia]XP_034681494.1 protein DETOXIFICATION 45, chloroplastic [Vitis riparia]